MDCFELGGYLPLELPKGKSYFADIPEEQIFAVNTGRTALAVAVSSLGVKKVFAPAFYCPDVIHALESLGVEMAYYRIDSEFMPVGVQNEPDAAVILVDYFGILGTKLLEFSADFEKVIFDNAHSFYTKPVLRSGVMNVYSCRKFFGVSDGAYLIGEGIQKPQLEQDVSYERAIHLFKSIELGTNAAYQENKHNENVLGDRQLGMSRLTQQILCGVDYGDVARRRRHNFRYLNDRLAGIQLLNIKQQDTVPYMYPLLLSQDIHKKLVEKHIYVPYLWSQLLDERWNGTIEQQYSKCIVPLPLDQRYADAQLEYMVQTIEKICEDLNVESGNES